MGSGQLYHRLLTFSPSHTLEFSSKFHMLRVEQCERCCIRQCESVPEEAETFSPSEND